MPLLLGGTETERLQAVVWDTENEDECRDASERIAMLVKEGFNVIKTAVGETILSPPLKDRNHGVFRILTDDGDDRIVWDRTSGSEVKDAYKKFNELVAKGYTAYAVTEVGQRGHKIDQFDPALEEIIMVPQTMPG